MDPSLREAVLGSSNIQTPTSPLGSFPELAKMYQSSFQLPQSSGAANILGNQAQKTVADQEAAAAAAKKAKQNYQRVKKADGGYGFFDGNGNEISAYDYANIVGKNPADVLADSENPIDIGYSEDYKNLNDYIKNKLNSKQDATSASAAKAVEDQVSKAHGVDLGTMNPQQIIEAFKAAYPTVYGRTGTSGKASGGTFIAPPQQADLTGGGTGIGG